ncbi:glycosyltransferase [Candidatus Saccharibacteria bacterium]|nr:glycosyltransferase [Candidatus Saccharibacteria bacterium]
MSQTKAGYPKLTIIIPTLNEEKRIGATLKTLAEHLKSHKQIAEVLVVDANSSDKTKQIADKEGKHFSHYRFVQTGPKVGKGKQVRDGIFEAHGDYVLFMDADLATPLKYLDHVYDIISKGGKVGICVRNLGESHKGLRKFISSFGNWLVQTLLVPGIKDTQCGFKVFEKNAAHELFGRQHIVGWGFDMEILAVARKLGYPIELIEVPDWRDITVGSKISTSGLESIKVALQVFIDLLNIKWGIITGRYKKVTFHYVPYEK